MAVRVKFCPTIFILQNVDAVAVGVNFCPIIFILQNVDFDVKYNGCYVLNLFLSSCDGVDKCFVSVHNVVMLA